MSAQREQDPARGSDDPLRAEFDACFRAAYPRLVGQSQAIGGDVQQAHDAVREAFARAWQRWRVVRELDDPAGWVRAVALRIGSRRSRRRFPALGPARRAAESQPLSPIDPQNLAVLDALHRLPETHRRALVLHHMARLEVSEIAEEEGIAQSAVRLRLAQGREALAGLLDDLDAAGQLEGVRE